MNSFGANLKQEREARGITLQQISDYTRIGVRLLRAIEEEQLDQLPGGIFVKSFVRQYARFLGIDEEKSVREYEMAIGVPAEPVAGLHGDRSDDKSGPAPLSPYSSSGSSYGSSSGSMPTPSFTPSSVPWSGGYPRLIMTAAGVGILLVGAFYLVREFVARPSAPVSVASQALPPPVPPPPKEEPPATQELQPSSGPADSIAAPGTSANAGTSAGVGSDNKAAAPAAPAASAVPAGVAAAKPTSADTPARMAPPVVSPQPLNSPGKPPGEAPAAEDARALTLEISARKECWLSISSDGQKQWQGVLSAGGTRRVQARDAFQLTIGDAGAVTLTLNGKTMPPVGRPGEVKTLNISAKGLPPAEP